MKDCQVELRLAALAVRFRQIGDQQMRDLPFYNTVLDVEAREFGAFDEDHLIGVLITPWFMNLLLLPLVQEAVQEGRYGESRGFELPNGTWAFRYGGDPEVGAFWAHSLHSPMLKFSSQAQARAEARLRLAQALGQPRATSESACNPGRRAFLVGVRSAPRGVDRLDAGFTRTN